MSDEMDDELEGMGNDPVIDEINTALLELIGEVVKIGILIAELPKKEQVGVQSRYAALAAAINQVDIASSPKKHQRHS